LEKDPVRLGNRTYRAWEKLELPKYFLNLHQNAPTLWVGSLVVLNCVKP